MLVGYVRVSTVEQSEERQIVELRDRAGVEKFFVDKVSAKRPKFDEMMNFLREGDELIVFEFSRLARSTTDLLNIVETLTKKDVKVRSLKEQLKHCWSSAFVQTSRNTVTAFFLRPIITFYFGSRKPARITLADYFVVR